MSDVQSSRSEGKGGNAGGKTTSQPRESKTAWLAWVCSSLIPCRRASLCPIGLLGRLSQGNRKVGAARKAPSEELGIGYNRCFQSMGWGNYF